MIILKNYRIDTAAIERCTVGPKIMESTVISGRSNNVANINPCLKINFSEQNSLLNL